MRRRQSTDSQSLANSLFRSQSVCDVDHVGAPEEERDVSGVAGGVRMRGRRNRQLSNVQSADMSMSCLALNEPSVTSHHAPHAIAAASAPVTPADVTYTDRGKMIRSRSLAASTSGPETIGDRMRQRRSRNLTSEESSESPSPTPEVTPARTRRTPSAPVTSSTATPASQASAVSRTVSDGGGSAAATGSESMKDRMDRRRRERGGTMSEGTRDSMHRSSIDLSTLRQKSSTHDVTTANDDVTQQHARSHPPHLRRATSVSASQETLNLTPDVIARSVTSSAMSRRQRREAWRNSCSNISEQTTPENATPKQNGGASGSHDDAAGARQRATEARENRERPWRAAQRSVTSDAKNARSNGSLSRDPLHASHQNLASTSASASEATNARARRKEAWRGSQGSLVASHAPVQEDTPTLSRAQRREAWRNSQTNLSHDVSATSGVNGDSHDVSNGRRRREMTSTAGHLLGDNRLHAGEEDALSERDYRERLRKLSRSRNN